MKPIIYFLFVSLVIGPRFSQAQIQNTVYGTGAGTGGYANTHIGAYTGRVSTGGGNTFLGNYSGRRNTTGGSNTFLGNKYDVVSDERLKENVHELADALERVQQVKGVSYVLKEDATARQDAGSQQKTDKAVQYGFLAQNIQEIFPELVTEDEGLLAVNYQGMIPVLVEALKALTLQQDSVAVVNASVIQQIVTLDQRLDTLEKAMGQQKTALPDGGRATGYWLEQNHPNPFSQSTTIRYQVSEEAVQVGLLITNLQGVEVQRFDQLPAGAGEVQIMAGSLTPGTYVCTLFADGLLIGSQRMILTR